MLPKQMLVIDTETTGLGSGDVILEIAAVRYSDAEDPSVIFQSLIRPPAHITAWPEAQAIHGISPAMLQDAPSWIEVWPRLQELFADRQLASYNWEFEKRIIQATNRSWEINDQSEPRFGIEPGICLMKTFCSWKDGDSGKWWKLVDAATLLGIPQEGLAHRAAADALMAARLVQAMKKAGC